MASISYKPSRPRRRRGPAPADALYGYGYDPGRPSVRSVAHDEAAGDALFVVLDRPCVCDGLGLPLAVPADAAGPLAVVAAVMVLPLKARLTMAAGVPAGSPWRWADTGAAALRDAATGAPPNAGAGWCADVPGPWSPPPPAVVVTAVAYGASCVLIFDRPVTLAPGATPDDAITFDGGIATGVTPLAPDTLEFFVDPPVSPGSGWAIGRQPAWVVTDLENPSGGTF